jgi:uncharacterized protein (DUF362 family)
MIDTHRVAVVRSARADYPRAPFHPPEVYPELAALHATTAIDPENHVYRAVRESLQLLELDAVHFGTPQWNPLGDIIHPGERVLLKPNWVSQHHVLNDSWEQIITHGSVLRALIDYVQLALAGSGEIALADGPMLDSDFTEICRRTGADQLPAIYAAIKGAVPLQLLDLRSVKFQTRGEVVFDRQPLPGDPRGGVAIDLGKHSAFYGFRGEGRLYGADYDTKEVNSHHHGEVQEYLLSGTAMQADVIIDVPKLKTHHKVGVTLALKGVVGLNCGRNWLPHRTQGVPKQGGDQFATSGIRQRVEARAIRTFERASLRYPRTVPPMYRFAKAVGKHIFGATQHTIRGGGWHGNDTLWRMVHDINRALTYGDAAGKLQNTPTRRRIVFIDGFVAGEGMGPVHADPRPCGVIIAGVNPVAADVVGAELMGFEHRRIPMLEHAFEHHPLRLIDFGAEAIEIRSNVDGWSGDLKSLRQAEPFRFAPPLGWNSHIERSSDSTHPVTPLQSSAR